MAWRPNEFLIEGELDNTSPGRVTGWMKFAGDKGKIRFELTGDFHTDIKGKKIIIKRLDHPCTTSTKECVEYMKDFCIRQVGEVGDITCEGGSPYIEWYSENNGRVVLEPKDTEVKIV